MLITLNELGKFLYKTINEFMAWLTRKCRAIGQCCGCLPPERKKSHRKSVEEQKDKHKLLENERINGAEGQEEEEEAKGIVSFNL
jgi:hypothetical protein